MQAYDKIYFLILRHLHFEVLDTLELLRFFLNEEVLAVADNPLDNVDHFISVSGREKAVLRRNINLSERLLELVEALMVRCLLVQFVRFVVHNHLEAAKIKLWLTRN